MHGPVVYKDDVLGWLKDGRTATDYLFRAVFTKHSTHRDQREYRFFVQSEKDMRQKCYLLDVSPELLSATATQAGGPIAAHVLPDEAIRRRQCHRRGDAKSVAGAPFLNPSVPVRVGSPDATSGSKAGLISRILPGNLIQQPL